MSNDLNNVGVSQQSPAQQQTPAQQDNSWFSGFEGADVDYIKNKGWDKDPSKGYIDVYKAYRHAERVIGTSPERLVKLPSGNDPQELQEFYTKLGRPEDPTGYQYTRPDTIGEEILGNEDLEWFSKTAFDAGLSSEQYAKLLNAYGNNMSQALQGMNIDKDAAKAADRESLLKEWGKDYDNNINLASDAMVLFDLGGEEMGGINKLQEMLGIPAVAKLFHKIATKVGEDTIMSRKAVRESQRSDINDPQGSSQKLLQDIYNDPNKQRLTDFNKRKGSDFTRWQYLVSLIK